MGTLVDCSEDNAMVARAPRRFVIKADWGKLPEPAIGDSINCQGICLSVISSKNFELAVEASATTLSVTTASSWQKGDVIHLEPALRVGDSLDGHFVFGHVDGVGLVHELKKEGESLLATFAVPSSLARLLAVRGSVAIDGVSLTICDVVDGINHCLIGCALIPLTCRMTRFSSLAVGDRVNIEADMLARLVARAGLEEKK